MGHSFKSEVGQMLQKWVQYHLIHDPTESWLSWDPSDPEDFRLLQKYAESDGSIAYLPSNLAKNLVSLWGFMNLLMKKDRPDGENNKLYYLMDEQWTKLTAHDMRSALIDEEQGKQNSHMSPATASHMSHLRLPTSPVPVTYPMHLKLASFKKTIQRGASAYSTLKDERYFDKFQRDVFITANSHNVSEILDPNFTPGSSPEEQDLFEAKQVFMYKVFNETLLTDMGRTKVRKYLNTTDAQAVWKEYSEYMTTSSKGASEKRKITHYVTNTELDSQFRGTTQQSVLHFYEEFRRLDDLTDISERMPESIKMALLQNAVKDIPQLSIVETLDEYTSTTCGNGSFTHLNYSSYYNLLINACVRYDATKTSTPSKRRNVYAASGTQDFNTFKESHETHLFQDIDTPPDDFYQVHQIKNSRNPPHLYLVSRKTTPESLFLLHPRNHLLLRNMMDLCMSLLRFINSLALKLLLPSRNTILKLSTKWPRKGESMSLMSLIVDYLLLSLIYLKNRLTLTKMMMHLKMKLIPF